MTTKHTTDAQYLESIQPKDVGVGASSDSDIATASHEVERPVELREYSHEEMAQMEKKLVRKIDIRLLPMLIIMYIMNYLDRNNIAAARLTGKLGLQKSLNMNDTQYNVSASRKIGNMI